MGWGGGGGWQERDEIAGKKKEKAILKKKINRRVKKIASMFSPGLQKHMDFSPGTVTRSHPEEVEHLSAQRTNPVRRTEMVHFSLKYAKLSFPIIMIIFAASPVLDKLVRFPPCRKIHVRQPITGDWTL